MSTHPVFALPLGLPLGLELYSVRDMLPKDYAGTLKKVAALGYREVEAAGYYGHSAADVKAAMASAGLRCVSAHYSSDLLSKTLDDIIAFHEVMGAEYILCSYPGHKNPPAKGAEHTFTLEDWHWNAEQFNKWGAKVKAAGFRFGYHNHTPEFVVVDGVTPYDELMKLTDPALVTFEMDCGWVTVGGGVAVAWTDAPGVGRSVVAGGADGVRVAACVATMIASRLLPLMMISWTEFTPGGNSDFAAGSSRSSGQNFS